MFSVEVSVGLYLPYSYILPYILFMYLILHLFMFVHLSYTLPDDWTMRLATNIFIVRLHTLNVFVGGLTNSTKYIMELYSTKEFSNINRLCIIHSQALTECTSDYCHEIMKLCVVRAVVSTVT